MHQPRRLSILFALAVASVLLASGFPAGAQTPPDNTKVNKRDQAKGAVTADQQKENSNDRDITQKSGARSWTTRRFPPTRIT